MSGTLHPRRASAVPTAAALLHAMWQIHERQLGPATLFATVGSEWKIQGLDRGTAVEGGGAGASDGYGGGA